MKTLKLNKKVTELTIKLFNKAMQLNNTVEFGSINKIAVKKGYIVHPDVCNDDVYSFISTIDTDYNATFYKNWDSIISKNRLGAAVLIDEKENVLGIITDGDIRRMLEQYSSLQDLTAAQIAHAAPITISPNALAVEALALMEKNDISQLIVAADKKYIGMIHIHDLMKEGIL